MSQEYIYIIQIGDVYKIGRTTNPQRRIRNMSLPVPPNGSWHAVTDSKATERALHHKFRSARTHGEWFRLSTEQLREAEELLAESALNSFIAKFETSRP